VALKTDAYYRKLAEDALRAAGIDEPPVEVERLARHFGIPVRPVMLPSFFTGAIVYEDGLPVMLLNANKEQWQQREALAHMVGHVLVVLDDPSAGYPRAVPDHSDADVIGSQIVLPESLVRDQAAKWFNDHRYLARLFAVDEKRMMNRMLELGIIKQRGILWDY